MTLLIRVVGNLNLTFASTTIFTNDIKDFNQSNFSNQFHKIFVIQLVNKNSVKLHNFLLRCNVEIATSVPIKLRKCVSIEVTLATNGFSLTAQSF